MKITEQDLLRQLLILAGWAVEREPYGTLYAGKFALRSSTARMGVYDMEPTAWAACRVDYLNDLNACFALAAKQKLSLKFENWWIEDRAIYMVTDGDGRQYCVGAPRTPAMAYGLAILSAHVGERCELEDTNG